MVEKESHCLLPGSGMVTPGKRQELSNILGKSKTGKIRHKELLKFSELLECFSFVLCTSGLPTNSILAKKRGVVDSVGAFEEGKR